MAGKVPTTVSSASGASVTSSRGTVGTREITGNRQTDRIQQNAATSSAAARALPYGDGVAIIEGVSLAASPVTVTHKLGRAWRGFEMKNFKNSGAGGYYADTTAGNADKFITISLEFTGDGTADVWVW